MDTPIYEKMLARWSGENPEEIKQQYGWWPLIKKLEEDFVLCRDLGKIEPEV